MPQLAIQENGQIELFESIHYFQHVATSLILPPGQKSYLEALASGESMESRRILYSSMIEEQRE